MNVKHKLAELLQWKKDHQHVHVLEQRAIQVAREEMTRRLNDHNDIAKGLETKLDQKWFEKVHAELVARVSVLEGASREASGRQEPITGILKWAASILAVLVAMGIAVWFGHVTK